MATQTYDNDSKRTDANPSQADYDRKFTGIADAEKLRSMEGGLKGSGFDKASRTFDQDSKGRSASDLAQAEKPNRGGIGNMNRDELRSLFNATGKKDENIFKRSRATFAGISARRKALMGLGTGGLLATMIAIFLIVPLYRLPSVMDLVTDKVSEQAIRLIEKRAERLLVDYLIKKAGGTGAPAKAGSPVDKTHKQWDEAKLDEKVYKRTGLKLTEVDGDIRLFHNGKDLGPANTYEEFAKILESEDQDAKDAALASKTMIRSVIPAARLGLTFSAREHFKVKFMNGNRYGTPEYDKEKTPDENIKNLKSQQADINASTIVRFGSEAIKCLLDRDCSFFSSDPKDSDPNAEKKSNEGTEAVNDTLQEAANEAKQDVVDNPKSTATYTERLTEKILAKMFGKVAGQILTKGIPFLGWIDLAMNLIYITWQAQEQQWGVRAMGMIRESLYGAIFSSWKGYADQLTAGKMDPAFVTALTEQLSDAQNAETYQYVTKGSKAKGKGVKVKERVDNNISNSSTAFMQKYNIAGQIMYYVSVAWVNTITRVLDWAGQLLGWVGGEAYSLLEKTGLTALVGDLLKTLFGNDWVEGLAKTAVGLVLSILGVSIDATARGAELFNNVFVGGAVALNSWCKVDLGCRALTEKNESWFATSFSGHFETDDYGISDAEYLASRPLRERLFSRETSHSLMSQIALVAPSNLQPATVTASFMGAVQSIPANLFASLTGNAGAVPTTVAESSEITGVRWYGSTVADRASGIAAEIREVDAECPEVEEDAFDVCKADTATLNAITKAPAGRTDLKDEQ